ASSADGVCEAADYGLNFIDGSDTRVCDGVDNNCDGVVDLECCFDNGAQEIFQGPFVIAEGAEEGSLYSDGRLAPDRSIPVVVKAADDAPEGATALVVWRPSPQIIAAQYIDRDGTPV